MTMEDIRVEGRAGNLGSVLTAVAVDTPNGKAYRLPTAEELTVASPNETAVLAAFGGVPFGVPEEPTPKGGGTGAGRAFSVQGYGLMKWRDLYTSRQLLALGTLVAALRSARAEMAGTSPSSLPRSTARPSAEPYPSEWIEAIEAYLACGFDRMLDFNASTLSWISSVEAIGHTFVRYALPMTWDFCEAAPINAVRGGWEMCLGAVMESSPVLSRAGIAAKAKPHALRQSATDAMAPATFDAIVTDPPYYDAIPYSDLMDYFYIWLRRTLKGISPDIDVAFSQPLSPKWNHEINDGELIDDSSRHGNDAALSKKVYEDGMARVF